MFTTQAKLDPLRTLAYTSLEATFVAIGPPLAHQARIICFTNTSDGDVIFTMDPSQDELIVPAGGFKLFDITTNHRPVNQDDFCFAIGTQWYVRYAAMPTKNAVYIEVLYAQPQSTFFNEG
jgi:hypothetical protein